MNDQVVSKFEKIIEDFVDSVDYIGLRFINKRFLKIILRKHILNKLDNYNNNSDLNIFIRIISESLNKIINFISMTFSNQFFPYACEHVNKPLCIDLKEIKDDIYLYLNSFNLNIDQEKKIDREIDTVFLFNPPVDPNYNSSDFKNNLLFYHSVLSELYYFINKRIINTIFIDNRQFQIIIDDNHYEIIIKITLSVSSDRIYFCINVKDLLSHSLQTQDIPIYIKNSFNYRINEIHNKDYIPNDAIKNCAKNKYIIRIENVDCKDVDKQYHGIAEINSLVSHLLTTELQEKIIELINATDLKEIINDKAVTLDKFYEQLFILPKLLIPEIVNKFRAIALEIRNFKKYVIDTTYQDDNYPFIYYDIIDNLQIKINENNNLFICQQTGYKIIDLCIDNIINQNLQQDLLTLIEESTYKNNKIDYILRLQKMDKALNNILTELTDFCVKKYSNP